MFKSVWWLCSEVSSAKSSHKAVIYNGRSLMYSAMRERERERERERATCRHR